MPTKAPLATPRAASAAAPVVSTTPAAMPTVALSVRQPWGWAIVATYKPVENRSWKPPATAIGKTIAIHASTSTSDLTEEISTYLANIHPLIHADLWGPVDKDNAIGIFQFGGLIGTAQIAGYEFFNPNDPIESRRRIDDAAKSLGCHLIVPASRWANADMYCWLLRNAVQFRETIPCAGKLNLWSLSPALQARIAIELRNPLPAGQEPKTGKPLSAGVNPADRAPFLR